MIGSHILWGSSWRRTQPSQNDCFWPSGTRRSHRVTDQVNKGGCGSTGMGFFCEKFTKRERQIQAYCRGAGSNCLNFPIEFKPLLWAAARLVLSSSAALALSNGGLDGCQPSRVQRLSSILWRSDPQALHRSSNVQKHANENISKRIFFVRWAAFSFSFTLNLIA